MNSATDKVIISIFDHKEKNIKKTKRDNGNYITIKKYF